MPDRSLSSAVTTGAFPVRVALIEDNVAIQELVTMALNNVDIMVEICPLGWQAQRCIRNNLPHVIILDVNMPNVDGIKLFYFLRGDAKTASIPVIFLTANPMKVGEELPNYEAMDAVVLPKPFHYRDLVDIVQAAIAP